jgi:micrococcal nuclease
VKGEAQARLLLTAVLLLASGLSALALAQTEASRTLTGQVVRVVDGDTIHVRIGDRIEKVRYIGVNAPELHHPKRGEQLGGREAAEVNRRLVDGQGVRLEVDVQERDRYGRLLAYVYAGDMMVNAEMVAQGYAQVMTIPANVKHQDLFLKLQREARLLQLGLWKSPGEAPILPSPPTPPAAKPATKVLPVTPAPSGETRPGVPPQAGGECGAVHPIKGNFTTSSGERCIYHVPGGEFYGRTRPERCYATDEEARRDGCRASKR